MSKNTPPPLKRKPAPCRDCGTATTNYCNRCKKPFCPVHLHRQRRGIGWFCEECEAERATEEEE